MRNISFKQILILLIISIFLFGDFLGIKKRFARLVRYTKSLMSQK